MLLTPYTLLCSLAFIPSIAYAETKTLKFPLTKPTDAVPAPPDFVALGFETAYMDNYANSPNNFAQNLIDSLSKRTGTRPVIRVGGTSGDRVTFNPNLAQTKKCVDGECPNGSSAGFELGPTYFDAFKKLEGVRWTIQAPLGDAGDEPDMRRTLTYVRRAWEALGNGENVAAIALGNEPSLDHYKRPEQYHKTTAKIQKAIVEELGLEGDKAHIFEVGDIVAGAAKTGDPYDIKDIFQAGFNDDKKVKFAADHYYQVPKGQGPTGGWDMDFLQSHLMSHTAITSGLSHHHKTASFIRDHHRSAKYILSETGATTVGGPIEFVAGFGACLWSVDFQLASLAMVGAHRVVDSGRPAAGHASWVPDDSAAPKIPGPRVQAPWVANIFVAAFIGNQDVRRDVVKLHVPGEFSAGYAAYGADGAGDLDRFALINLRAWNGSDPTAERGSETFVLPLGDNSVESVKVRRLHAEMGVGAVGFDVGGSESNITYAGEQWSYEIDRGMGHFPEGGGVKEETIPVRDGAASVEVLDSEAVIVYVR